MERPQIGIDLARGLFRVHVKNNAFLTTGIANRGDILDYSDFVVYQHDGCQDGIGPQGRPKGVQIDQAIGEDIEICKLKPLAFKLGAGVENSLVLGFYGDDVTAAAGLDGKSVV